MIIFFAAYLLDICYCQAPRVQIPPKTKYDTSSANSGHSATKSNLRKNNQNLQYGFLQGIWTDCPTCNALFTIKGRRVIYFDSGVEGTKDEIVYWAISSNTFFWNYGSSLVIKETIIKLTKDSLVLRSKNGVVTKLSRMK